MKKLFTLTMLLMLALGMNAQVKKSWDFTKGLSDETIENLNADATHWAENGTDANTGEVNNWKNIGKPDANSYLMANGVVIPETFGLLIDIGSNKDNSIHLATTKMRLTRKNTKITFPKLANGQKVKVVGRSANSTATNRGIAPVQNHLVFQAEESSPQTGGACIFLGNQVEGSEGTYTFVWKVVTEETDSVDVQFQLTPDAGIDFTLFQIDEGDAPEVKEAQKVGYLYSGSYDSDYAYAFLSGDSRFALTEINVDATEETAASLREYESIVISPTIGADNTFLPVIAASIAYVPTLNLNPALYEPLGLGKAVPSGTNVLTVLDAENATFEGLDIAEGLELLTEGSITGVELGDYFAADKVLAKAGDVTAIHMHNANRNAYMLLPLTLDDMPMANIDNIAQLIPQALQAVTDTKQDVKAVGKPNISVTYENGQSVVSITASNSKVIYYTLDGTEPTTASMVYGEPFTLYQNTTVKAFGVGDGYDPSEVASSDVVVKTQAATPVVNVTREAGKSTVTLTCPNEGVTVYYSFINTTTSTEAKAYEEPVEITEPTTIYAFAQGGDFLTSEVTSKFVGVDGVDASTIRWDVLAHFDANADDWKGKGQQTNEAGEIINANYLFTWGKNAGEYYDYESIKEVVTGSDGNDSIIYNPRQPETLVGGEWVAKSIGQVMVWESLNLGYNIGDTSMRNPDAVEDMVGVNDEQGITANAMTFGKQPSDGPFNASLETVSKQQAPFDVIVYAGNGNEGEIPTMQIEVSADGETWTKLGDINYSLIKRNWKRTKVSYEGTDEVYVRVLHTAAKSSGQIYDIYVMNNGEKSSQYSEGALDGIETLLPAGDIVRTEIYTLNGARVTTMVKGVNIIRRTYANGVVKTHKVIVR
ncbi:MAG: chitobiase/beta-hexosaminidase C-terminal domain-containing protein [Prevotella sp.]|nr:chitobiase/beta-hexosaminidase C-terminal domain-containing protein [Prevotella sp.]